MYREYLRLPRRFAPRRLVAVLRGLAHRNGRTLSGPDCEELRVRYATPLDGDALARLAQLVERVVRLAGEIGRDSASPAVARHLIGLQGPHVVSEKSG
jgi:hypothetical protein